MQRHRLLIFFGLPVAALCWLPVTHALAPTSLSITASNVTMPSSGNGVSNYTITGIPASGTVTVGCFYTGAITTARIPDCSYGPIVSTAVAAGEIVKGTVQFYPFGSAVPAGLRKTPGPSGHLPAAGLALAGVLLLGLGARRRKSRWFALTAFAACALASLAGINACSNPSNAMKPGAYQYTITADYQDTGSPTLSANVSTTIEVTVP